jgi:hypothetical protein
VLERLDPNPEFYDAKRGAAVGVLQAVIAGKEQVGAAADAVGSARHATRLTGCNNRLELLQHAHAFGDATAWGLRRLAILLWCGSHS